MKKTRRSLIAALACALVLVLSLGIVSACGTGESASAGGAWYYGAAVPAGELGQEGDYYLNTKTLASYKKTANGWTAAIDAGEVGEWLYGVGAPGDVESKVGDFYLDTKSGDLYHKSVSGWGEPVLKLFGKDGRDGVLWYSGTQEDPNTYGPEDTTLNGCIAGDFYLDRVNFEVWQLGTDGTWIDLGSLTGSQGPKGDDGDKGIQGPEGPKGDPGQDGEDGKSAYELYVEQYKATHEDDNYLPEEEWLASLKGDKGEKGDDGVKLYYGKGAPEDNAELKGKVKDGDLYIGQFDGFDGKAAGTRLYQYVAGIWVPLMESLTSGTIALHTINDVTEFANRVADGNSFDGVEVHLKTDLDFGGAEGASLKRALARAASAWTPIGSDKAPFKGTFDGEDHIISNFTVETSSSVKAVGFFGNVEGATIKNLHFVDATVTAEGTGAYGAVVVGEAKGEVTMSNVTVTGSVTATDDSAKVGGLVGKVEGTLNADKVETLVSGVETGADGKQAFVGEGDVTMKGDYATGETVEVGFVKKTEYSSTGESKGTSYEILNLDGLKAFRDSTNAKGSEKTYEGETVVLTTDIDLKDEETWTPISSGSVRFLGNFDGQNHTIFNLKIINDSKSNIYNSGFFGKVGDYNLTQGNVIKNLTIENVEMPATATPTDENPHGKTDNFYTAGAFIGGAQVVNLENLTLKGDVYIAGKSSIGGIVGAYSLGMATDSAKRLSVTIQNITVDTTGTISASGKGCGAVIGALTRTMSTSGGSQIRDMTMSNIIVTGVTLKGAGEVGGIAGGGQLEKVNITIDGAKLTNVKILSAGLKSEVNAFGALISHEARRDTLASYMSTVSTFILRISAGMSVSQRTPRQNNIKQNSSTKALSVPSIPLTRLQLPTTKISHCKSLGTANRLLPNNSFARSSVQSSVSELSN